jgi:hypothetical protein
VSRQPQLFPSWAECGCDCGCRRIFNPADDEPACPECTRNHAFGWRCAGRVTPAPMMHRWRFVKAGTAVR